MINTSNSTLTGFLHSLKDRALSIFSQEQKKIMIVVLPVFLLLGVVCFYRDWISAQSKRRKTLKLSRPTLVSQEKAKSYIAALCQQAATEMKADLTKDGLADNLHSAKIFISLKKKGEVRSEREHVILQNPSKFDSTLSEEIDKVCTVLSENIREQLDESDLAHLSISWDLYLKENDGRFSRLFTDRIEDREAVKIHTGRRRTIRIPAENMHTYLQRYEVRNVINDQMDFI